MNSLDLLILALVAAAALGGYRLGLVARVASWIGMALGIVVAARLLPAVLRSLEGGDQSSLLLIAAGTLLGGAFIGQAIGLLIGARLHFALPLGGLRTVDRIAGAGVGALGVLVSIWLLLPTMADIPGWLSEQSRRSAIAGFVDEAFPEAPDTLAALRRLVGDEQFPQVFSGFDPAPRLGPPPASSGISQAVANSVVSSTVKIEGIACSRIQEGSGFVVGTDLVVTNAHVVAGERESIVERSDGTEVRARAVAFDPNRDLAILRAPGLNRPSLGIGDTDPGGTGGVFGHPGGGPLRIAPFSVAEEVTAEGYDIYDRNRTERDVVILSSQLRPGDSGAALVNPQGRVVGVAFAIAPDRPGVAYALTSGELNEVLQRDLSQPADTGPCLT